MTSRRNFVRSSGLLLTFMISGCQVSMTPAAARTKKLAYRILNPQEASTLEAFCEALVPGSSKAGISYYIDHQLAASKEDCLLMIKYLGVAADTYIDFYQAGLANLLAASHKYYQQPWSRLDSDQSANLLADITKDAVANWQGAPASFLFFVLRADASDIVYGSTTGFEEIGMPYLAHIQPNSTW